MVRFKSVCAISVLTVLLLGGACDPAEELQAQLAYYERVAAKLQLEGTPETGLQDPIEEARRLMQQERPRLAAGVLLAVLATGADPETGLSDLSQVLEKLQEPALAEEALQLAIRSSVDPGRHWCQLAELRIRQRDYTGARNALRSYEQQRPDKTAHASFLAGLSFQSELRLEEALESYLRCGELEPDNDQVQLKVAQVHSLLGNEPLAAELLEELLGRKPDYLPALMEASRLYQRMERFDRALETGLAVLEQEPDHRRTLFLVSQCYRRTGERQKAEEVFARFTRAEVRADSQRRQQSREEAIPILIDKGRFALTSGRPEEARQALQQALELDPEHRIARQLIQEANTALRADTGSGSRR